VFAGGLPAEIRRSLTWGCGAEMARHPPYWLRTVMGDERMYQAYQSRLDGVK
jgi:hypothetical protein